MRMPTWNDSSGRSRKNVSVEQLRWGSGTSDARGRVRRRSRLEGLLNYDERAA
jgi:hypothetical protein